MSIPVTPWDWSVKGFPSEWHRNAELSVVCILNGISLITLITRLVVRKQRLKHWYAADFWVMGAGVCLIGTWASQIGTNRAGGSGLPWDEDPRPMRILYWRWVFGWLLYYPACSMLKVSVCASLREILPYSYRKIRMSIVMVCAVVLILAVLEILLAFFECQPLASNWDYRVASVWCMDLDVARYTWIAVSVLVDFIITWIPLEIIRHTRLRKHERVILFAAFSANLLGTIVCFIEVSAIYLNSPRHTDDPEYTGTYFVIMNCLEMFFYSIGASATVFSRYAIAIVSPATGSSKSTPQHIRWHHRRTWFGHKKSSTGGNRSSESMPRNPRVLSKEEGAHADTVELVGMATLMRHAQQSDPNSSVDEP